MMMDLGILADGSQQALPAHGQVIVPPAHILLQSCVDQKSGIVRISDSTIGSMPLDIPSHLHQGSGEGAFPLVPWPDGRSGQAIGATLEREGQHTGAKGHLVLQWNRQRWANAELHRSTVLIDQPSLLPMPHELREIPRVRAKAQRWQAEQQAQRQEQTRSPHRALND